MVLAARGLAASPSSRPPNAAFVATDRAGHAVEPGHAEERPAITHPQESVQIADTLERSSRVHDVASLGVSLCRGHIPSSNVSDGRTYDSPLSLRLFPCPPTWEAATTTCPRRRAFVPTGDCVGLLQSSPITY